LKRQVDWLVNGSLTGPIFSRALNQLTQLEIFPARDKDWPVNECKGFLFTTTIHFDLPRGDATITEHPRLSVVLIVREVCLTGLRLPGCSEKCGD